MPHLRIAHLTSVHSRYDTRIFLKECRSLAAAGHQVVLVVADGLGEEQRDGVGIVDVGKSRGRLARMLGATRRVMSQAVSLDCDVYHLHDPELLPVALALRRRGKHVIFDAHEDLPSQILSKTYLHPTVRQFVAMIVGRFEHFACGRIDAVVTATPSIRDTFVARNTAAVDINNFPLAGELEADTSGHAKAREVAYVGGITAARGIGEVVSALALTKSGARLNLCGGFQEAQVKARVEGSPGWPHVNALGFVSRTEVARVLGRSAAGLVTFLPEPNHIHAQPNKMFEYMSAGLPVIASNFPLWRDIIEGNDCGICVDPTDPRAIAAAIDTLVEDPSLAGRMGENARRVVLARYNWGLEEKKLLDLYSRFLPSIR